MIRNFRIQYFKSIPDLSLDLGRVTVLIGANGSGKSNILEAIAFAAAAVEGKLDNEFLSSRGIRMTEPRFMYSAFEIDRTGQGLPIDSPLSQHHYLSSDGTRIALPIYLSGNGDDEVDFAFGCSVNETRSFPTWQVGKRVSNAVNKWIKERSESLNSDVNSPPLLNDLFERLRRDCGALPQFLIYTPENTALRNFQSEGQILPLGIRGEGLFAHLKGLNTERFIDRLDEIKNNLSMIDWFESFEIPKDLSPGERSIRIRDRYLPTDALFDQRSANEGFLFLLFYMTLLISPETPAFFAIDNIDASLNPKLCTALLQQIVTLAKQHDKQVILTTHNPAILDGLDLADDEQRLLVVERNMDGHTRVRRVQPPKPSAGQQPVSLSEAFVRGYIGGLPKNF